MRFRSFRRSSVRVTWITRWWFSAKKNMLTVNTPTSAHWLTIAAAATSIMATARKAKDVRRKARHNHVGIETGGAMLAGLYLTPIRSDCRRDCHPLTPRLHSRSTDFAIFFTKSAAPAGGDP